MLYLHAREMKKILLSFVVLSVFAPLVASGVTIKKAAPVATKKVEAKDAGASLVPSVIGLVTGVMQISQQQKTLTEECLPSSQEIQWVNTIVKEWAKTGAASAEDMETKLGQKACKNGETYESSARMAAGTEDTESICFDAFTGSANEGMVWNGFPEAKLITFCNDGSLTCAEKEKVKVSNVYDIFNIVDFSQNDYTKSELTMASKLMAKIENCSTAKLDARKKALWGDFLTTTIGNMGQKTNTASIMDVVGSVANVNKSNMGGALQSLGGVATQFLAK